MSNDTFISFYLATSRIHIFRSTLKEIGEPKYIMFLVKEEGPSMVMTAYDKKDFHSHRVPKVRQDKSGGMEVRSLPLCSLLKNRLQWEEGKSYRIPGKTFPAQHLAVFDLPAAEQIQQP